MYRGISNIMRLDVFSIISKRVVTVVSSSPASDSGTSVFLVVTSQASSAEECVNVFSQYTELSVAKFKNLAGWQIKQQIYSM